eukprot:1160001-Pelagomonas_calceolata.AAC.10
MKLGARGPQQRKLDGGKVHAITLVHVLAWDQQRCTPGVRSLVLVPLRHTCAHACACACMGPTKMHTRCAEPCPCALEACLCLCVACMGTTKAPGVLDLDPMLQAPWARFCYRLL